jgi:hypothetical protein
LRRNIPANAVYMFPFKGNLWKEGRRSGGISAFHTGVNFSIGEGDQADLGNTFDTERPNATAAAVSMQSVSQWFNYRWFTPSTHGTVGDAGRNLLVGLRLDEPIRR